MKKAFLIAFILITGFNSYSQDITDEQLYKYALLNTVVDEMKAEISSVVNDMIKNQEGIDGNRYVELSKAKGDEAKLAELNANDFEKKFLDLVEKEKNERIEDLKTVNSILATKMLGDGGKVYKSIKSALKSDEELSARYDQIKADLEFSEES